MKISKVSVLSNQLNTMDIPITEQQWRDWNNADQCTRPHIQYAFPYLSNDEREFLLSGITPLEWEQHFGDDDVEEFFDDENDGEPF